ncbi:DUF4221 family protein [uncultured Algoriphagus sp.]|uniref:DUF4221 family protein n=1 Tax=uncultured Algoriphagus sp. TaxID=417365 RepID=UPI0030EF7E66
MNKFNCLILAILVASCSSEKKSGDSEAVPFNFSYTIDTLMVDSGDSFLFLQQNLASSDLSPDGKYLLNFNAKTIEMEIVDLDELKLSEVVPLEQEGPNGIGTTPYFGDYKALSKDEFMFAAQNRVIKLDLPTNTATYYSFKREDLDAEALAPNETLKSRGLLCADGAIFYCWYGLDEKPFDNEGLVKIDLVSSEVNVIPIPQLEKLEQFAIEIEMNDETKMAGKFGESVELLELEDRIVILPSAINELWVLDKSTLEITVKSYESNLISNSKKGNYPRKVDSRQAMQEAMKERSKEVSFFSLMHDPKRDMIWRISAEFDHMKEETVVKNYFFTFFDMDLNQLGEFQLEDWEMTGMPFIKDGDYYQFINIEDEMAFIRLQPTFD